MKSINVRDLPEIYARNLERQADSVRKQLAKRKAAKDNAHVPPLPRWDLGVKGQLTREEIYDDRV